MIIFGSMYYIVPRLIGREWRYGSLIKLHKIDKHWDPTNRISAMNAVQNARGKGEILTGLLYINSDSSDLHDILETADTPLNSLTQVDLCPGSVALSKLNASLR